MHYFFIRINSDGRMPYFSSVLVCTNVYAATSGAGSGVGHSWEIVTLPELMKWTACPICNGAIDGRLSHWSKDNCVWYNTYTGWKLIKLFKLNNNLIDIKKNGDGYDPCLKYAFIYKVLMHNMNYMWKQTDLDALVDESTWGFGGSVVTIASYVHCHKLYCCHKIFTSVGQSEIVMHDTKVQMGLELLSYFQFNPIQYQVSKRCFLH